MNRTMFFKKKVIIIHCFVSIALFISCQHSKRPVNISFYHWKTGFQLTDFEKKYCNALKINKIYVRFFDVDWDQTAQFPKPIAIVHNTEKTPWEIVPTIFITNRTFIQLANNQIDTLVQLILEKIFLKNAALTEGVDFKEIQIDCDWTTTTQERFFAFLKKIKSISNKKITATIRLHQVKFKDKTGVPPVDAGVLMAYNMGNLDDPDSQNSILDLSVLSSYLSKLDDYPLPLDMALPIFSWGVVLRDSEVIKLINNLTTDDLSDTPEYFLQKKDNRFEILKNTYLKGFYLYKDDEIRIENTTDKIGSDEESMLYKAADVINQNMDSGCFYSKKEPLTVIFYHLDSVMLQRIDYEELENIAHRFK